MNLISAPKRKLPQAICLFALVLLILLIAVREGFARRPSSIANPPASATLAATADFYVATNGDDSWPGTLSQPFRTLDHARLAVQTLKTQVSGRTITVFIRNGTYFLPSTWNFTSVDSGTATTPIVYANYPGESPVISGGQLLSGWVQNSSGQWQTTVASGTYFTQLWVNGNRRYPARTTPNGYLYITGGYSTTGSKTNANQLGYDIPPAGGVPSKMANLGDVDLIVFEAWNVSHMRISSVNTTTRRITTTKSLTQWLLRIYSRAPFPAIERKGGTQTTWPVLPRSPHRNIDLHPCSRGGANQRHNHWSQLATNTHCKPTELRHLRGTHFFPQRLGGPNRWLCGQTG